MGESSINGRTNVSTHNDTSNNSLCDAVSTQGYGTPWYYLSSPVKPLYEVVVMAGHWYGYKRVGGGSS